MPEAEAGTVLARLAKDARATVDENRRFLNQFSRQATANLQDSDQQKE